MFTEEGTAASAASTTQQKRWPMTDQYLQRHEDQSEGTTTTCSPWDTFDKVFSYVLDFLSAVGMVAFIVILGFLWARYVQ